MSAFMKLKEEHYFSTSKVSKKVGSAVRKSRSRVKANSGGKIAIIRQQELKQIQKDSRKSPSSPKITASNSHGSSLWNEDEVDMQSDKDSMQAKSKLLENSEQNSFQIPVLGLRVASMRMSRPNLLLQLQSNYEPDIAPNTQNLRQKHPLILNNNDLVDPQIPLNNDHNDNNYKEGHFTLINLNNNEQVEVGEEDQAHIPPSDLDNQDSLIGPDSDLGTNHNDITTPANSSNSSNSIADYVKVVRVRGPKGGTTLISRNDTDLTFLPTAEKTMSMFMAQKMVELDEASPSNNPPRLLLSSSITAQRLAFLKDKSKSKKRFHKLLAQKAVQKEDESPLKMKMTMTSSSSRGVIAKVHAHVSQCPKLKAPAEIICDINIRDSHGHPNPQLVSQVKPESVLKIS